jgi:hypothetical protein
VWGGVVVVGVEVGVGGGALALSLIGIVDFISKFQNDLKLIYS